MKIDLFSIPVFIGNIDLKKIKYTKELEYEKTWHSRTLSTHNKKEHFFTENSLGYIADTIIAILDPYIKANFKIELIGIWENLYKQKDFQEPHIHIKSNFSFIIYKKLKDISNTVFVAPHRNISEYCWDNDESIYKTGFRPLLKEGQMIIFPSFLEHYVLPSSGSKTIAGNIKFEYVEDKC